MIIGATSLPQLEENIGVFSLPLLSEAQEAEIDGACSGMFTPYYSRVGEYARVTEVPPAQP